MLSNVPMVRTGDVLLVCFEKAQTWGDTERFTEQVKECLPGVRVVFAEGVSGLAVFRPEAPEGDTECEYPTISVAGE
jgi:hypothetical protein